MAEYTPTPGPLPGEQWIPSCGDIGHSFISQECGNCARDKEMNGEATQDECDRDESLRCQILGASFRGEAVEWRQMPDGEVKCIKFVEKGQPIPPEPDTQTLDLFGGQEGGAA